jgi:hypothetical protein
MRNVVSYGECPLITDEPSGFTYNFGDDDGINENAIEKIHRGDLVSYPGHISMVYSERWGETNYGGDYDVIHAFSWECSPQQCVVFPWLRKVGVTANSHIGLSTPAGIGRIKLW